MSDLPRRWSEMSYSSLIEGLLSTSEDWVKSNDSTWEVSISRQTDDSKYLERVERLKSIKKRIWEWLGLQLNEEQLKMVEKEIEIQNEREGPPITLDPNSAKESAGPSTNKSGRTLTPEEVVNLSSVDKDIWMANELQKTQQGVAAILEEVKLLQQSVKDLTAKLEEATKDRTGHQAAEEPDEPVSSNMSKLFELVKTLRNEAKQNVPSKSHGCLKSLYELMELMYEGDLQVDNDGKIITSATLGTASHTPQQFPTASTSQQCQTNGDEEGGVNRESDTLVTAHKGDGLQKTNKLMSKTPSVNVEASRSTVQRGLKRKTPPVSDAVKTSKNEVSPGKVSTKNKVVLDKPPTNYQEFEKVKSRVIELMYTLRSSCDESMDGADTWDAKTVDGVGRVGEEDD